MEIVADPKATRSVMLSLRELRAGTVQLPEGLSFINTWTSQAGEFPHAPFAPSGGACGAALDLRWLGSSDVSDPWCTNAEPDHTLHVAHIAAGVPIAAWTDDPAVVAS